MALVFLDGFDHYGSADILAKWTGGGNSHAASIVAGRRGGNAMQVGLFGYTYKTLPSTYTTLIAGFAFKPANKNGKAFFGFYEEGGPEHVCLALNGSGNIVVYRGNTGGTVLGTGATALATTTFYYIEAKVVVNGTTGSVVVKINGTTELNLTSQNTQNGGAGTIGRICLGETAFAGDGLGAVYDDLYVCDTTGGANNDFLGDSRIDTLLPTGDGTYTQFTPSTGTSHYALVDEATPSATDYNSSATVGNRDSYTFPALASLADSTVRGVQVNASMLSSDGGAKSAGTMARLSSTDTDGTGVSLGASASYVSQIYATAPGGAAWTQTSVNSAEFGVKVTA